MARTKQVSLKSQVEKRILDKLTSQPRTTSELAELTGDNYHTIRRVLKELESQGFVYARGYKQGSLMYKLTDPVKAGPNDSLPSLKGPTGSMKLTGMLKFVGKEDKSATATAAVSLPRNITRILMSAIRHVDSNGKYDIDKNLKNIRLELETHRAQLVAMLGLYDAVLQADVLWDARKIKAIPYDRDFDREEIISAYHHYYPED